MKELSFLFANFHLFLIVFIVCLCDAIMKGIGEFQKKKFSFKSFPNFLFKVLGYTVLLVIANVMEHYGEISGYVVAEYSISAVAGLILLSELGEFTKKINELKSLK